jgi:hypothetical protein
MNRSLLMADRSACFRWLVLRDLYARPEGDAEMLEVESQRLADPLLQGLVNLQQPDGCWMPDAISPSWGGGNRIYATSMALARLGTFGFDTRLEAVRKGADFLFSQQCEDGAWELHHEGLMLDHNSGMPERSRYSMIPLQTAVPLRGLAACGYVRDPRSEKAYDWLLAQRLPDGAWPTGIAAGVHGYVGGYRRLPHSRWGCRSNTTGALICLGYHPERAHGEEAQRALDHILARETRERQTMGIEMARMVGVAPLQGFISYFARFDLALVLELCWRIGASLADERVADLAKYVRTQQGPFGLWESELYPQAARWISYSLARSLSGLGEGEAWISQEPRTPFRAYPKEKRRF